MDIYRLTLQLCERAGETAVRRGAVSGTSPRAKKAIEDWLRSQDDKHQDALDSPEVKAARSSARAAWIAAAFAIVAAVAAVVQAWASWNPPAR